MGWCGWFYIEVVGPNPKVDVFILKLVVFSGNGFFLISMSINWSDGFLAEGFCARSRSVSVLSDSILGLSDFI